MNSRYSDEGIQSRPAADSVPVPDTGRVMRVIFALALVGVVAGVGVGLWQIGRRPERFLALAGWQIPALLGLAAASHGLRFVKWHFYLRINGLRPGLRSSFYIQFVGFALSVSPGKLGELLKFQLLKERTGAPIARTAPILFLERATDGIAMLAVAALALPSAHLALSARARHRVLTLIAAAVALVLLVLVRRLWGRGEGRLDRRSAKARSGLGAVGWGLAASGYRNLTPANLALGVGLSLPGRLCDSLLVLLVARMLGGVITYPQAMLCFAVAGMAGGASLMPGGLGAAEAALTGMLVLAGLGAAPAFAASVTVRLFTLWLAVGVGLLLYVGRAARARGWLDPGRGGEVSSA